MKGLTSDVYETLKITEYAEKEANGILSELDLQSEKLMEIQKITEESRGLLFLNSQLMEKAEKSTGAKFLLFALTVLLILSILILVKVRLY